MSDRTRPTTGRPKNDPGILLPQPTPGELFDRAIRAAGEAGRLEGLYHGQPLSEGDAMAVTAALRSIATIRRKLIPTEPVCPAGRQQHKELNTMEIKIELDLPSIISQAVSAERVQPLVDKAIAEAIKDAVNDATGYRSAFREALKKQLAEAMPHGLALDDTARFQHMANQALTEAVHGANAQTIQTAMKAAFKELACDVPARIKLSELMEQARDGFHKDDHEAFYAHLKRSDYGGGWLALDSDEDCRSEHSASMRLSFNEAGEVYALKLDGRDITPRATVNAIGSFDGLLLAMYVGRTSLEVDMDEGDVEGAARAKEDY